MASIPTLWHKYCVLASCIVSSLAMLCARVTCELANDVWGEEGKTRWETQLGAAPATTSGFVSQPGPFSDPRPMPCPHRTHGDWDSDSECDSDGLDEAERVWEGMCERGAHYVARQAMLGDSDDDDPDTLRRDMWMSDFA